MSDLRDILQRLMLAKGPDKEIDADIFGVSGLVDERHCASWRQQDGRNIPRETYLRAWAPAFTESQDAVVRWAEHAFGSDYIDIEFGHRRSMGALHGRAEICGPSVDSGQMTGANAAIAGCVAVIVALLDKKPTV